MSSATPVPWDDFSQDPRRPGSAALRASDRDREVVTAVLAEGYADGRLAKEEYDERSTAAASAKTLGELTPIIADLVPQSPAPATPQQLHEQAVDTWRAQRRKAASGVVVTTVIFTAIWAITGLGWYWPVFVILAAAINLVRVQLGRHDLVTEELRRLEEQQRKALDDRRSGS